MKVSWRNVDEDIESFEHHQVFNIGEKLNGKGPRDFMIHLIRDTEAVAVAFNGKTIWDVWTQQSPEVAVIYGMMGEIREAPALVVVDYTTQGDWIDNECRSCGGLYGTHSSCPTLSAIDKGWCDVVEKTNGC